MSSFVNLPCLRLVHHAAFGQICQCQPGEPYWFIYLGRAHYIHRAFEVVWDCVICALATCSKMSDTSDTDSDAIVQAQPANLERAQDIIKDIRFRNGHLDPRDDAELSKTSSEYQQKTRRRAEKDRQTLARYTKT